MFAVFGILLTLAVAPAIALEPFENFREGSCSWVPVRPIQADRDWVHSLEYIPAGSKYHMLRLISPASDYRHMQEDSLYYDSCLTRNSTSLSKRNSVLSIFGFGGLLTLFDTTTRSGVYLEATSGNGERDALTVTLTDNKSYAFIALCRTKVDQRGWVVVSNTEKLSSKAKKNIGDHAASLGFNRDNFVFLDYDNCNWGNPSLDRDANRKYENSKH